ncbi:hypothetical protein BJ875DRAFT_164190 [Amylocarpus encephaloides]|uniref:Nucleoside 2-deoxyribosyltransferase n=1 Tax=Amylocarpus encephaloides TaxID=45428 RepID=A0A9P7YAQ4_9HELO|nr:hypothetical protein BJ875DRAFT_164190 [Amylocarpus encephaloides]
MSSSQAKPKVYLAGPDVFLPTPVARGEELKALCSGHGLDGLFPLDNALAGHEPGSFAFARAIRGANMELVRSCDGVLANMTPFRGPSMDVGTAYEMGVGAALGKVVVGYTTDGGMGYVEKVHAWAGEGAGRVVRGEDGQLRDVRGMAVEEFRDEAGARGLVDNLMVSCGIARLCLSEEEAVRVMAGELLKRAERAAE